MWYWLRDFFTHNSVLAAACDVPAEEVRLRAYFIAEADGFRDDPAEYWRCAEIDLAADRLLARRGVK